MINVVDREPTRPGRVRLEKEDGSVEFVTLKRADEPTVEGTPINKALFDSIQDDIGLVEDVIVYVASAGSDALGDGTVAKPYATINKALSALSKNLNGHVALVSIAPGTYPESVEVVGFSSGELRFTGNPNSEISIKKLTINNTAVFSCQTIALYVSPGTDDTVAIDVTGNSYATFGQPVEVADTETGVVVREESRVRFTTLTANNITGSAVYANGGRAHIQTLSGSNNGVAINANRGGTATYESMTLSSAVKFFASNGGRIYTGSQNNIPSY